MVAAFGEDVTFKLQYERWFQRLVAGDETLEDEEIGRMQRNVDWKSATIMKNNYGNTLEDSDFLKECIDKRFRVQRAFTLNYVKNDDLTVVLATDAYSRMLHPPIITRTSEKKQFWKKSRFARAQQLTVFFDYLVISE
ncbi:unnamed protein product [Heligmosomoides polygyrus]|uniref:Uncharacterized protein n=1 Tax=Heligmosomoides polygyrus TaxID=6339 RepID=A0A3P7XC30_HELPZ|nr:unnamed protein product [Heligmosomoides polygyrus]